MRTTVNRRPVFAAALIAVAVLLAGCGGATGAGPAPQPTADRDPLAVAQAAPDATLAAGSARYEADFVLTMSATEYSPATTLDLRSTGTYDFARQIGDAETVATGGGIPDTRTRGVIQGNVVFEQPEGDDRWYRVDYSDVVNTPVGQQDPSEQLELLRGTSDDVREVGTEDLRGTSVRHYAITIDPVRLADNTTVVVQGGLVDQALASLGPIPADVYVDDAGLVRKMRLSIVVTAAHVGLSPELASDPAIQERLASLSNTSEITIEYFDFGVPVTAVPPDPALVVEGPAPFDLLLPPN